LNRARRTKRRVPPRPRVPLSVPPTLNQTWPLDFMRDTLYDGRVFPTPYSWSVCAQQYRIPHSQ
jgi:putative transposase